MKPFCPCKKWKTNLTNKALNQEIIKQDNYFQNFNQKTLALYICYATETRPDDNDTIGFLCFTSHNIWVTQTNSEFVMRLVFIEKAYQQYDKVRRVKKNFHDLINN